MASSSSAIATGAAAAWLATLPLSTGPAERASAPPLVIGTWGSAEQELVAGIVAQQLRRRGQATSIVELPTRHAALEALAGGEVQVVPEYTASLLEHLNGAAFEASADPVQTTNRLAAYTAQFGVLVTRPSPASIMAAFLVRRGRTPGTTLQRLSDLRSVAQHIATHLPATTQPVGTAQLAVPLRLSRMAVLGGRGYEVLALQHRLGQLGFAVSPTGTFDQVTLGALQAFQIARGLPPSSDVDALTQRSLDRASPPGSRPPGAPVVYLTYDDGPDPRFTPAILDLLDAHQAKATFFVVGVSVEEYPALVASVVQRGHALGNHTYGHMNLRRASTERVQTELQRTTELVRGAAGVSPTCMRPPQGSIDAGVREVSAGLGLEPVLWHIDTEDWRGRGTASIVQRALEVQPGAVVLLHDGGGNRTHTVEATALLLEALSAKGYRFESLPQC